MSFDIYIGVYSTDGVFGLVEEVGNCTYNLVPMIGEAFKNYDFFVEIKRKKKCKDLSPYLEKALNDMKMNKEKYLVLNPPNRWGTYEGLLEYLTRFLELCKKYPNCDIRYEG